LNLISSKVIAGKFLGNAVHITRNLSAMVAGAIGYLGSDFPDDC
jgi:hypothetical protein